MTSIRYTFTDGDIIYGTVTSYYKGAVSIETDKEGRFSANYLDLLFLSTVSGKYRKAINEADLLENIFIDDDFFKAYNPGRFLLGDEAKFIEKYKLEQQNKTKK